MAKIRVLVVDDAVVVRKILTDVLSEDPDIEICGVAANGKIALQKITQNNPDIITLDVEMPELNGIETVRKIRETHPRLPIIMFSTLTERGAEVTLEALSAGASDYVTKPANVGSVTEAKQRIKSDMITRIKALALKSASTAAPVPVHPVHSSAVSTPRPVPAPSRAGLGPVMLVGIGISTGGPNALAEVLPALPADFPAPIVIVQHMPPLFTKMLAERLNGQCKLLVHEGAEGMRVEAGNVYIAPGNYHMLVTTHSGHLQLTLNQEPQENSCRPAVDPLFRSIADVCGGQCVCAVLTGMGQDGLRGCEIVRERGGYIIAQDEATSVVWGMPGFVAKAGLADEVVPLGQMAAVLDRRARQRGSASKQSTGVVI